jgi:hypothetical protein
LGEREAGCACALGGTTGSVFVDMGGFPLKNRDGYVPKLEACIGWGYPVCRIGHIFVSKFRSRNKINLQRFFKGYHLKDQKHLLQRSNFSRYPCNPSVQICAQMIHFIRGMSTDHKQHNIISASRISLPDRYRSGPNSVAHMGCYMLSYSRLLARSLLSAETFFALGPISAPACASLPFRTSFSANERYVSCLNKSAYGSSPYVDPEFLFSEYSKSPSGPALHFSLKSPLYTAQYHPDSYHRIFSDQTSF